MNILHTPERAATPVEVQRLVLGCVSWEEYGKFLEGVGKRPIRLTYDRGTLEIMTISTLHEIYKNLLGYMLIVLMEELDIPMKALGSTTFRRRAVERGLEPDQCYFLASAARVRSWRTFDVEQGPPPDLAIEVDVSSSCLDRMQIYASLGVPEVWRLSGERLEVHRLRPDGRYEIVPQSVEMPFVPMDEIPALLQEALDFQDDRALLRALRTWVRTRVAPRRQAPAASGGAEHPAS